MKSRENANVTSIQHQILHHGSGRKADDLRQFFDELLTLWIESELSTPAYQKIARIIKNWDSFRVLDLQQQGYILTEIAITCIFSYTNATAAFNRLLDITIFLKDHRSTV